jgi:hypothetical protein
MMAGKSNFALFSACVLSNRGGFKVWLAFWVRMVVLNAVYLGSLGDLIITNFF